MARQCAQEGLDGSRYRFRLCALELLDREQRAVERRIKAARFPVLKSLETVEFRAIPSVTNAWCWSWPARSISTGERTCWRWATPARARRSVGAGRLSERLSGALHHRRRTELLEARDDKRLLRFQKQLAKQDLLIVDELGYVPLSKTGAELLFEIFSQRYEQASTLVTSNLPFNEWTEIFGSERLTGALLDRLTHHVHILELNGESYRLEHSKKARQPAATPAS